MAGTVEHTDILLRSGLPFSRTVMWCRIGLMMVFTAGLLLFLAPAILLKVKLPSYVTRFWHTSMCYLAGIDKRIFGKIERSEPTLYVVNHISYIDILVLGSLVDGSFVAKSDVAGWGIFGWLSKLQQTVFVQRKASRAEAQKNEIRDCLETGRSIILFPEGTSSDGNRVLPFKSSLFSVAYGDVNGKPVKIQPITLSYSRLNGVPMGRAMRPFFAWYGDMDLVPHLKAWLGMGGLGVDVIFHESTTVEDHANRKALAGDCCLKVTCGLTDALTGRTQKQLVHEEEKSFR